jgi:hypothetical protein
MPSGKRFVEGPQKLRAILRFWFHATSVAVCRSWCRPFVQKTGKGSKKRKTWANAVVKLLSSQRSEERVRQVTNEKWDGCKSGE